MTETSDEHEQRPILNVETLYENSELTLARISLNGLNRRIINHRSTTTYRVVSGEGTMFVGDVAHSLQPGVSITIPKGTAYHDEGTVEMFALTIPPFEAESIEYLN